MSFLAENFVLSAASVAHIQSLKPRFGFNGLGEIVYLRTYSRKKADGSSETWNDTVIRVTQGIMSIRKDYFKKHRLAWDDNAWQKYAHQMAVSMFEMYWLPAGRGLWSVGTPIMNKLGSAAANNCAAVSLVDFVEACTFFMDALMCGIGVGCDTAWGGRIEQPKSDPVPYVIPDSREGWVESTRILINAYIPDKHGKFSLLPIFDYSQIRPEGTPLKTFGGTASGPGPLIKLHKRLRAYLITYLDYDSMYPGGANPRFGEFNAMIFGLLMDRIRDIEYENMKYEEFEELKKKVMQLARDNPEEKRFDHVRFQASVVTAIGACVVSGNIRRSSEIILGDLDNPVFRNLKNTKLNPEYTTYWMSNNSVHLAKTEDFHALPQIAERIRDNGEPGIFNQINITRWGRVGRFHAPGDPWTRESEQDQASLCNPCAEIPLESYELCNLAEVFPLRCIQDESTEMTSKKDSISNTAEDVLMEAIEYATFYTSTLSLLPTHWEATNAVIARNHRIGVSISGIVDVYEILKTTELTRLLRAGYRRVREVNTQLSKDAGVPAAIRVTTVKPSGSISLLAGVSPGMNFPTFKRAIRRMRISETSPLVAKLKEAGYPCEKDIDSDNTLVFEFPIDQGHSRPATEVPMWEQFSLLALLQREWSDNMVSVTIYFNLETEAAQIEHALAQFAPLIKSCSMFPHTKEGVYAQPPYEGINEEEYHRRLNLIKNVNWSFKSDEPEKEGPKYCTNATCEL